jgi:two-component system cell cycle response regulator
MGARQPSPSRVPGRRKYVSWAMRGLLATGSLLLGAFVLRAITGFGGASAQKLFATWISDAIVLSAVSVCVWRAAVERRDRAMWALAGLGMASWGLGNAYWEHNLASGVSLPNPSPADAGYLGFYPLVYLAVIAARRRQDHRLGVGLWLDGMIGAAACATVGAVFVLEPVLKATEGESVAGALTNIAYPVGDLTLLAMLVVTTATVGWRGARGLAPLAAGMALFAFSDTLYLVQNANETYQAGGVLDAGWLVALVLMAGGAATLTRTGQRPVRHTLPSSRTIVPGVAGLLALVVLGVQPFTSLNTASLVCALLTLALVVTRMTLSLQETAGLLVAREREAALDPLTGLANRRILISDLTKQAADASKWHPTLLVLFDLDGFKGYNDTFGHGAGDNLLIQVADSLTAALGDRGRAYRLGGDEFCALLSVAPHTPEIAGEELAAAMSQQGEGFLVTASYGCALAPTDGRDTTALLRRADDEMYSRKGRRRPGTENQIQDVLIAALSARDPGMKSHATDVASLAAIVGEQLGLSQTELRTLSHAAALHDIGKIAIPDELLDKTAELDMRERRFLQTHPLIAQRIISAAPALASAAQIVRSVQERWDGGGYPDGLIGEAIPLSARIISVCNAYNAMTRPHTHREAMTHEQAIAELERSAGTQFDPKLVETLVAVLAHPPQYAPSTLPTPEQTADLLVSREAAARRRLEAQLSYQSDHDPLTGLLNRRRFSEELERVLRYASRYGRSGALVMLDLDNLKLLNDIHGHSAGDDAVKLVAREILGRVRTTDIVARLGGDEFAIALHETDEQRALAVAEDIRVHLCDCEIDPPLRISMGIALFEDDQELVADDLLTAADIALYDAKEAGRGQIRVYHGDAGAALGWVQRIRDALAEERFVLYAQPIVDLRGGGDARRELLVRMLTDDGDTIPPEAFIPTAERFGMINDIDRWVTSKGLSLACEGEGVSINLSAHSIGDARILELVRTARREGLGEGRVIFEITETAAMASMQDARAFAEALGELGCDVALDDFGTGFGSFSYLKHLPSRYLKIDIEFVREVACNATDQQVVRSITEVGHSLDKLIIAEGVENRATLDALRGYGVDYAQGFYLGVPERVSPPTQFERSLRAGTPAPRVEKAR